MKKSFLTLCFFMLTQSASAFVVLIDPGHGGSELGAVGVIKKRNSKGRLYNHKVFEKNLALRLAKKVKTQLEKHFSVYLTRSFDTKVSLQKRAELADTVKADIFLSIHFNGFYKKTAAGFETFYLDNHNDKAVKKIEDIENKTLKGEDKIINQILIDLVIEKTVPSSKKLARRIHSKLDGRIRKKFKMKNRDIKPGLFYVLALSKRPAVLIEGGFLTNPTEVKKIISNHYLDNYALAIAEGVIDYHRTLPRRDVPLF